MDHIIALLGENPILLLFLIAAIGYPLGQIKVKGASIGVAAVLFVGLFFGALDESIKLPEIIYRFGLVIFVYCIGLSSAPMFFSSFRKNGLKYNALILLCLSLATGITILTFLGFGFMPASAAGLFCGSLTNTPALAAILEHLETVNTAIIAGKLQSEAVVAYSITYPMGVIGVILPIFFLQKIWEIDYKKDLWDSQFSNAGNEGLAACTVHINFDFEESIQCMMKARGWNVIFGRHQRDGILSLTQSDLVLKKGDLLHVIAQKDNLEKVIRSLGRKEIENQLDQDLSVFDKIRVFISNQDIAGKRIVEIPQFRSPEVLITRIRRGDREFLPEADTRLMLGDQLRFVTMRKNMAAIRQLCGDSFKAISEFNVLSFGAGIVLGLLLGEIPFPMPGGVTLKLGIAGGPLIVALVLGVLGRCGKITWSIPYSANLVLRQVGLILFLAGIGTRSGYAFISTVQRAEGIYLFFAGFVVTCLTAGMALLIGYKGMKIPFGILTGILSGMHTQPAVLAFANEQSDNELPNVGYAMVFPVAMISKIILAQLLLIILSGV